MNFDDELAIEAQLIPHRRGRRGLDLTPTEVEAQRLQRQLDQWVDVATELYNVLEHRTSPGLPELTDKENCERVRDDEMEWELQEQSKVVARQATDLKFARQTESSLRNALVEKSRQLEHITEQSQALIQQLNDIEESLKQQHSENEQKLKVHEVQYAKLEKCCFEYQEELKRLKEELSVEKERRGRLETTVEAQRSQLQEHKHKNEQQSHQFESSQSELKLLKQKLQEVEHVHEERMCNMRQLSEEKDTTISELKSLTTKLQSKATHNEHQLQNANEKVQNYVDLLDIQKQRLTDMEDSLAESQKLTNEMQKSLQDSENENRILKSEITQLTEQSRLTMEDSIRLHHDIEQKKSLECEIASRTLELQEYKIQVETLERKLSETMTEQTPSDAPSPVISSMKRLQGLLYTRERDLRKSQLKICELEGELAVLRDSHLEDSKPVSCVT